MVNKLGCVSSFANVVALRAMQVEFGRGTETTRTERNVLVCVCKYIQNKDKPKKQSIQGY